MDDDDPHLCIVGEIFFSLFFFLRSGAEGKLQNHQEDANELLWAGGRSRRRPGYNTDRGNMMIGL